MSAAASVSCHYASLTRQWTEVNGVRSAPDLYRQPTRGLRARLADRAVIFMPFLRRSSSFPPSLASSPFATPEKFLFHASVTARTARRRVVLALGIARATFAPRRNEIAESAFVQLSRSKHRPEQRNNCADKMLEGDKNVLYVDKRIAFERDNCLSSGKPAP